MEKVLDGLGVSPGTAEGVVARLSLPPRPAADEKPGDDPAVELARVEQALTQVAASLEERATAAGGTAAEVLTATALMARDPGLVAAVKALLESGRPTAHALDAAIEGFCDTLQLIGGYMAERVADLRDVRDRALAVLLGLPMPGIPHPGHPYVLLARDLSPADTATLDPAEVLAVVTELGGPTSHTAILAKGLGLPAIVQCPGAPDVAEGTRVVVDGTRGLLVVDPDEATVAQAASRAEARRLLAAGSAGPGRTADGHPVQLLVNIGTVDEALRAAAGDNEGVGLFRTEALFLDRRDAPGLQEQTETYTTVLKAFGTRKVVVRTLDAGADKPLAFVDHGHEENPALGVRGLRVARRHPELLATQLQALAAARAATGAQVWVMAPMVAVPAEAAAFGAQAEAAGLPVAGTMVEVPAAALRASRIFEHAAFVSIGTNDLTQYTMAADRMQGELSELLDPWQPALLDLVAQVGAAGTAAGRPVGVCGEAAGDPLLALVLVGLGVTSLSMAGGLLPAVRVALGAHTLDACRAMAAAARDAADAASARQAVRDRLDPTVAAAVLD